MGWLMGLEPTPGGTQGDFRGGFPNGDTPFGPLSRSFLSHENPTNSAIAPGGMKPKSHLLVGAPVEIFNEMMRCANLQDSDEAVRLIADRPDLYKFAQKFSGWLPELLDERQLLARVSAEIARREIELVLSKCQK